jgi:beta-lactamase class D
MVQRPATCRGRRTLGAAILLPLLLLFTGFSAGGADSAKPKRRAAPAAPTVPKAERVDLRRFFSDSSGTFVLLDGKSGRRRVYNPQQAARRFSPYSTFKIPNTLIALETGVADGPDFALAWDRTRVPAEDWWPKTWARDHRLRTALRDSVVWFYQELARRVGPERMREHVRRFGYGNMDLAGGIDQFWLGRGLRISADEQVEFLRRAYREELGLSPRSTAVLKEILVLEDCPAFRLSGKSGTGPADASGSSGSLGSPGSNNADDPLQVGWHVGWVERGEGEVWFYAMNMLRERVWEEWPPARRLELSREILRELEVLPTRPAGRVP